MENNLTDAVSSISVEGQPLTGAMLQSPLLSNQKKRDLRAEAIKAYIRSKPAGTKIKLSEFMKVAHVNLNGNMSAIVTRMIRDGHISRVQVTPRTFTYSVPEDAITKREKIHFKDKEMEETVAQGQAWDYDAIKKLPKEAEKPEQEPLGRDTEEASTSEEEQRVLEASFKWKVAREQKSWTFDELETLAMRCVFYQGYQIQVNTFLEWLKQEA